MVLHNVYFWLKESVSKEEAQGFQQGIEDFLNAVVEIKRYEIGYPAATPVREVVDHSFAYSIFVWFDNVEDHNSYQKHPAHDVFVERFKDLWDKVQVLDSKIKEQ